MGGTLKEDTARFAAAHSESSESDLLAGFLVPKG